MKFKVFISSRNEDVIQLDNKNVSLSDIRMELKNELESFTLFGEKFIDVRINETFGANASRDSYDTCLNEVKKSDFLISLYNGAAGWAPEGIDIGICHAELSAMKDISTQKAAIIDISDNFTIKTEVKDEMARNENFKQYIKDKNRFNNPLKIPKSKNLDDFKSCLLKSIINVMYEHLLLRIENSNKYFDISGNNKASLDWKKMKYSERDILIKNKLEDLVRKNKDYKNAITKIHSIPDNCSVSDARAYTGRPFLRDQDLIQSQKSKIGPIHFIGVYGNATETQAKNIIGYPDVSIVRSSFGMYVWEQNTHIQMVFLVNCITQEAISSNFILFKNWCEATGELTNIKKRGKARYHILNAVNNAKLIAEDSEF